METSQSLCDPPILMRTIENALRAGFSLRQAVGRASEDDSCAPLGAVAAAARSGEPQESIFDEWGRQDADIAILAGVIRLQTEVGGNLADKLALVRQVLERRP